MAVNYDALRAENIGRYGTDVPLYGPTLLANRYENRSHFIFELVQNAEDALKRRKSNGSRSVTFSLSENTLRVSHFGHPFTERDIRGICGIAQSTKSEDLTAIGEFGI